MAPSEHHSTVLGRGRPFEVAERREPIRESGRVRSPVQETIRHLAHGDALGPMSANEKPEHGGRIEDSPFAEIVLSRDSPHASAA